MSITMKLMKTKENIITNKKKVLLATIQTLTLRSSTTLKGSVSMKTFKEMSLEELSREYVYLKIRSEEIYAKKKEAENELERRFKNGDLGDVE